MRFGEWVQAVRAAIDNYAGERLAKLLALDSDAMIHAGQLAQSGGSVSHSQFNSLSQEWAKMLAAYMSCLISQHKGERAAASKEYTDGFAKGLVSILGSDKGTDTEWLIPTALMAAHSMKQLAELGDEELERKGLNPSRMSDCAIKLQGFFSALATSKSSHIKRVASVAVVVVMMRVYFKLNAINNCKQPLQQIEFLKLFDHAPQSQKVALRYYSGRLAAYDEDFQKADEHLSYAFEHCASSSPNNIRRVLRYLIPVRMLLGVLPSEELLRRYGLAEYSDVRTAVSSGDLSLLLASLESNQARFIRSGTYLLLEKLQLVVVRRLLRKCALVHAELHPAKAHQVPLALVEAALKLQGIDKDPLELQCCIANLIFRKYVKGYLAYKAKVIVLAKADAFPQLSAVQLSDPFAS